MHSSLSSLGRSLFAAALAGAAAISMGCSSNTAVEDTRSQELASEEEDAACVSASVGDGSTCIDYVELKTNLHTLCEADGRVLVDLLNLVECPNGGGVVQADYVCCAPTPPDPNQDPGQNPSSDGCIYEVLGDGTTCELASTLEAQATAICDAAGLLVNGFGTSNDCPNGGGTYAKVACCPEGGPPDPEPPPDPVVCTYHALGDGSACASEATWAAEAQSICSAEGLAVTDVYLAADCADGTSSYGKLACCEP